VASVDMVLDTQMYPKLKWGAQIWKEDVDASLAVEISAGKVAGRAAMCGGGWWRVRSPAGRVGRWFWQRCSRLREVHRLVVVRSGLAADGGGGGSRWQTAMKKVGIAAGVTHSLWRRVCTKGQWVQCVGLGFSLN